MPAGRWNPARQSMDADVEKAADRQAEYADRDQADHIDGHGEGGGPIGHRLQRRGFDTLARPVTGSSSIGVPVGSVGTWRRGCGASVPPTSPVRRPAQGSA